MNGMDQVNGFPMEYEMQRPNGMKIHMTVTKVQLDAAIDDKTFEIPKGYDIKPMSEMGGPGGGGRIFRMGEN
jgi:outer membrane lipoprotein-sorting protein